MAVNYRKITTPLAVTLGNASMSITLKLSAVVGFGISAILGGTTPLTGPTIPGATTGSVPWKNSGVAGIPALSDLGAIKFSPTMLDDPEDIPVAIHEGRNLLLVTDSRHKGLTLINTGLSQQVQITDGMNAGYEAVISPDGRYVGYKAFQDNAAGVRLQAVMLYDIATKENLNLSGWQSRTGTPAFSANGKVGFTVGQTLFVLNSQLSMDGKFDLEGVANLVNFSADGGRIVYSALEGQVHALALSNGKDEILTQDNRNFWGPAFSPDGKKVLARTVDGDLAVLSSVQDGTPVSFLSSFASEAKGKRMPTRLENPIWLDGNSVGFLKVSITAAKQLVRQIYSMNVDGKAFKTVALQMEDGNVLVWKQNVIKIRNRAFSQAIWNGSTLGSGIQWKAFAPISLTTKSPMLSVPRILSDRLPLSSPLAKTAVNAAVRDSAIIANVPYISQVYDTRDGWNGSSSCGGTSAVTTLAYYGILPKHPITINKYTTHVNDYGFYITEKYSFNGANFNLGTVDNGVTGYGAYGFITKNDWEETREYMADYIALHGPQSMTDWSPTLSELKREIDALHPPVVLNALTTSGHYIVAIGYMKGSLDGTLIYNDPYGNRNDATYATYRRGIQAKYDYPGTNNGYANLNNNSCIIYSRAQALVTGLRPAGAAAITLQGKVGADLVNAVGARIKLGKGMAQGRYMAVAPKSDKAVSVVAAQ